MPRFTKGFIQPPEQPYHTTPEEKCNSPKSPTSGFSFGKFSTLPLGVHRASRDARTANDQRALPSKGRTSSLHQRRKASMSKLMRHFGETKIPAELFPLPPSPSVIGDTSEEGAMPTLRRQRTRSLDLSSLAKIPVLEAPVPVTEHKAQSLNRAHSLGSRSKKNQRASADLDFWEGRDAETAQNRVKRMRKMAQIFGPEVSYQLMVNPALQQKLANSDEPLRSEDNWGGEVESVFQLRRLSSNLASLSPVESIEYNDSSPLAGVPSPISPAPPIWPTPPTSPTPPASPTVERKRTRKLAKFFGVSQLDISSSITMQDIQTAPSTPSSVSSQFPSREVEVNVKIAGRRLWPLSPDSAEFKTAQMTDAIEQLRTLKAG
ncbi:hypothetical protein EST38_g1056 [Candolleomyces aberdarensis]|uniref:Uncharacterized protein n=1 Tax=Candolleomyces aberdarensis TaxID=2316362 RepID=A0A4Q2DWX1_9AGAR|nr:hypothetical protein EST38_g1056 [Candolleomyces aberdarensis]